MPSDKQELAWVGIAAMGPEGWPEFVKRMRQVAPGDPSSLMFARQAFIAGRGPVAGVCVDDCVGEFDENNVRP